MMVRYSGPKRRVSYTCTRGSADYAEPLCQGLSNARTLEALVAGQLLAAVQPAALEASLAAVAGVERQRAELRDSGACGESVRRSTLIGRPGSTRRASRRTGWWRVSWNAAGRRP